MKQLQITVIGGFLFNCKIFEQFAQFNLPLKLIDINSLLVAPFSFDELYKAIYQELSPTIEHLLIGYSTGGLFALKLFSECSLSIKHLVLLNSTPRFINDANWCGIKANDFNALQKRLLTQSLKRFQSYFVQLAFYPIIPDNLSDFTVYYSDTSRENLLSLLEILAVTDLRQVFLTQSLFLNLNKISLIMSDNDLLVPANQGALPIPVQVLNDSSHFGVNFTQLFILLKDILWNIRKN